MKLRLLQSGVWAVMAAGWLGLAHAHAEEAVTNVVPQLDTNAEPKVVQPAQLNLSPALAEVVRLAQSGADESVVVAYVRKAPAYTVSADEIIYLQDLGISDAILKALVEHGNSGAPGAVPPALIAPPTNAPSPVPEPTPVAPPTAPLAPAPVTPPATVTEFYQPLTPYGTWVIVEPYGWCWQPSVVVVNREWSPYCDNGRWLWSDSGWYWHSYYSWGWAPFHYGRWFHHPHRRWVWMPDRVWGPSWVCWRESPSYYGWAPLPPGAHFSVGVGWTFGGRHVGSDFGFGLSVGHFTFVGANHFADRHIRARRLPPREVNVVIHNTKVVNNYVVGSGNRIINRGVDRSRVESARGARLPEVAVREMPRQRTPAATVMPDRVTRVGKSEVVYRPGPKIEVPKKPVPNIIGQKEALLRQDAPVHRKPVGEVDQIRPPTGEPRKPGIFDPQTRPPQKPPQRPQVVPPPQVSPMPPAPRSVPPLQPAKPPQVTPPPQRIPPPQVTPPPQRIPPPQVTPPSQKIPPSQPGPVRPPPQRAPKEKQSPDE